MLRYRLIPLLLAAVCSTTVRAVPPPPQAYSIPAPCLVSVRERLARHDPALTPALAALRAEADQLLTLKPLSVLDKSKVAASGDKHDYFSLAPYFWPDPQKPDGLPYLRRDGEINPESKRSTDAVPLLQLGSAIETLGLAYYCTGHTPYAEQAARLARVWFLDPTTRMNPNMDYAQAIPGKDNGRGIGILDARYLTAITDGLALLGDSPAWTAADRQSFTQWVQAYYDWLRHSKNGRDEHAEKNNHGSWYDVQSAHLALFLGRRDEAKQIVLAALPLRVDTQIEPDGREPLELLRTKSHEYSIFNLEALCQLAVLAENVGVDFWHHSTPDGRSLSAALHYLAPYADPHKPWPKDDVQAVDRDRFFPLAAEALRHGDDPILRTALGFAGPDTLREHWRLLYVSP